MRFYSLITSSNTIYRAIPTTIIKFESPKPLNGIVSLRDAEH
jgi:hypothetical protein